MTSPMQPASKEKRFVVDSMLGKVAKWLRIFGFDTLYERITGRKQIASLVALGYMVITRNTKWCEEAGVLCLSENSPLRQLQEVVSRLAIQRNEIHLLERCLRCNALLERLPREQASGQVPDYVFETTDEFYHCGSCHKVYWSGSHPRRIADRLNRVFGWIT